MAELKNLTIISDDYPSEGRMVFVFVQQLVEALVDKGVDVSVIAPQSIVRSLFRGVKILPKHAKYTTVQGKEYSVYRPFSLSFGNGNKTLYKLAKAFNQKRINQCLNSISPQVVYGHFWHNARKGFDYAMQNDKPLFVACGEGDDALDNWASRLSDKSKANIINEINGVISVSTENKRKCLEYGISTEDNIIVLPNCINDAVFHPVKSENFRKQLGASESDFVISYTGAFIDRKGYNRLSDAVNKLNNESIKVIFSGKPMAGHESDKPQCNGIIHCGPVNHDDLPNYLCASDVFVLPTLKEGCCNAIVEALACGVPVISSDRAFNDDILNDKNSLRVDPEDVDAIASAILQLISNKDLYFHLKDNAIKNCGNYSIITRANKIKQFIESKI